MKKFIPGYALGWNIISVSRRKLLSMWVYISVVSIDSCPSISCTALRSAPPSIRCVAKECLKVCGLIFFLIPALAARSFIIVKIMALVSLFPLRLRNTMF
jgi:hypothetical protein